MARIYAETRHPIIWLDQENRQTNNASERLGKFFSEEQKGKDYDNWLSRNSTVAQQNSVYNFIFEFFKIAWFGRAWIVQEYVLCLLDSGLMAQHLRIIYSLLRVKEVWGLVSTDLVRGQLPPQTP